VSVHKTSRYLLTDVLELRNPATGGLVKPPFVDLRPRFSKLAGDDRVILYDTVDSWAGLGLTHMFDANAWWVIADMSGVIDPFTELTEAKKLRLPSMLRYQLNILPSVRGRF
jgi:hypothetical protein